MAADADHDLDEVPVPALADRAAACADRLLAADAVLVASHNDADGLTSGAVASAALERAGLPHEVVFYKQLDDDAVAELAATAYDTVFLTDFGSGQLDVVREHADRAGFTPVIADHHQPADATTEYHCNPLLEGIDGASELSGAGAAYLVARALAERGAGPSEPDTDSSEPDDAGASATAPTGEHPDPANRDLAALAVVGAVGDMQASDGELPGANAEIAEEGVAAGVLEAGRDLALYGKQTRPLPKLLEYASDVYIPGVSSDEAGAVRLLDGLDLELKDGGEWRRWVDLDFEERRTVVSALVRRAVRAGVDPDQVDALVGTSYTLLAEPSGTELRDADEFATLLNATARYDRADVGLAVCLGDREDALDAARGLLRSHRRNLSEGLAYVRREGVTREEHVQWFHASDEIRETIVGIVAGMAMGADGVDRGTPIVAFARDGDDEIKVSSRGTGALVRRGLDLSAAMREASRAVDGDGGGHDVAAGATIPAGREGAFVDRVDDIVGEQLG